MLSTYDRGLGLDPFDPGSRGGLPAVIRKAVMNAWNDAFGGAQPIRPFHFGSVKPRIESGRSEALSTSVL